MAIVYINDTILGDIGDAIRNKEGSSNVYYPREMAGAINNLDSGSSVEVDQAIVPSVFSVVPIGGIFSNISSNLNGFYLTNTLPSNAYNVRRCDIGDENISKPAYFFTQPNNVYGIFSEVNNIENISIISMVNLFSNCCTALSNNTFSGPYTDNMLYAYNNCQNITSSPKCGPRVRDLSFAYYACTKLTGSPQCGSSVIKMVRAYDSCYNLTGAPLCGVNVVNMYAAYRMCNNLTGSPACGPNVSNFGGAYYCCKNITGSPTCGDNVTDMSYTYYQCFNLSGSPVCGPNVTNMYQTYYLCNLLTGSSVILSKYSSFESASSVKPTFSQSSKKALFL